MTTSKLKSIITGLKNWQMRDFSGLRMDTGETVKGKIHFDKQNNPLIQVSERGVIPVTPKSVLEIDSCAECQHNKVIENYIHIFCVKCIKGYVLPPTKNYFKAKEPEG